MPTDGGSERIFELQAEVQQLKEAIVSHAVVDQAIEHRERLDIDAIWMQVGVVDEAAAARARAAGIAVVMDTCPKIEWRQLRNEGASR